ncbi:MAG: histidine kinase [Cyclobacteriaceae bacterium]|nr:histidine kinase [Cyclobacteriaceae bacterium]
MAGEAPVLSLSELQGSIANKDIPGIRYTTVPANLPVEEVANRLFRPFQFSEGMTANPDESYWFRFSITNNFSKDTTVYIYIPLIDFGCLYQVKDSSIYEKIAATGYFSRTHERNVGQYNTHILVRLKTGQTYTYYLQLSSTIDVPFEPVFSLFSKAHFDEANAAYYRMTLTSTIVNSGFIISMAVLFLFMLFSFSKNRQRIFGYYSAYLFFNVLYGAFHLLDTTVIAQWISYRPEFRILFNYPVQFAAFTVYNFFVIELLNLQQTDPFSYKFLKRFAWFYVAYIVIHIALMSVLLSYDIYEWLFIVSRVLVIPLNLFLIIRGIFVIKTPLLKYYIVGVSFFLISGAVAGLLAIGHQYDVYLWGLHASNFFQIGILIESLCFAFAIGYRNKLIDDERKTNQENYIEQLIINQKLIEETNIRLEEKVTERTNEVLEYRQQLEEQRQNEIKLEFENKISEVENVALRSQMNPHFLFNSLNAIKYLIMSDQDQLAINYLGSFSKLLRMILEYSKESLISLSNELNALQLYLEIESTRFDSSFHYNIRVDPNMATDSIMIPPLLLQPYVENAIWHGLLHKQSDDKSLEIILGLIESGYIFTIEDNGIGRAKAAKRQQKQSGTYRSMGTQITQDRIDLFNRMEDANIKVKFIDLPNDGGTRVEIIYTENVNDEN